VLTSFKKQLHLKQWFKPGNRLLLAISGGVDSVVLAHLLHQSGQRFSLAHCNFNLRGKDSQADEAFCRKLAKQLNVTLFVKHLDARTGAGLPAHGS
jgi:tRNA(Ile)-lysidine synthase